MNGLLALSLLAALVLLASAVVAVTAIASATRPRRGEITLRDVSNGDREQYTARTPAGPAVITRVFDDRGWAYEIETDFTGDTVRLYYVAPSMRAARDRLADLVNQHVAAREALRAQRGTRS